MALEAQQLILLYNACINSEWGLSQVDLLAPHYVELIIAMAIPSPADHIMRQASSCSARRENISKLMLYMLYDGGSGRNLASEDA